MHTNFKLSGAGEYLALSNPDSSVISSLFNPAFPAQYNDISYSILAGTYVDFNTPTPGAANQDTAGFYAPPPIYRISHGYFYEPFQLTLPGKYKNTDIYFTTGASTPGRTNGTLYTSPININTSTVIRAVAAYNNTLSNTVTQTCIFPDSVIHQSDDPPRYPDTRMHQTSNGFTEYSANYDMQQDIVNIPELIEVINESLISLPVMSIVSHVDKLFSKNMHPDSGGIYMYTGRSMASKGDTFGPGKGWVHPALIEYFNPGETDDHVDFQSNHAQIIKKGCLRLWFNKDGNDITFQFFLKASLLLQ